MSYLATRRIRDIEDGIVHIRDVMSSTLSVCRNGFAAMTMDITLTFDTTPTCLWCVAGTIAALPHWRLMGRDDPRRLGCGCYSIHDTPTKELLP